MLMPLNQSGTEAERQADRQTDRKCRGNYQNK